MNTPPPADPVAVTTTAQPPTIEFVTAERDYFKSAAEDLRDQLDAARREARQLRHLLYGGVDAI